MQLLISNGHKFPNVLEYTKEQVDFFLEGIEEVQEEEMKFEIMANLYGSRAEDKELKKVLNSLDTAKIKNNFGDKIEGE